MAVQEFDRPIQRTAQELRRVRENCVSLALLIAAVGFLGFSVLSLPGPSNDFPLPGRQLSEIPK
jgi:hypothetical protein